MASMVTLAAFCIVLCVFVVLQWPIMLALAIGLGLFLLHGLLTGHKLPVMVRSGWKTCRSVLPIIVTFMLIGMLTASWRASGTVPFLVSYASRAIAAPQVVVPLVFVCNALMSMLTGSAFATAATMGVITVTLAVSVGASPMLVGGAMLSGAYFGDRCSPMSTSALLVATLTGTKVFDNLRNMARSCAIPTVISLVAFGIWGWCDAHRGVAADGSSVHALDVAGLFGGVFDLRWWTVLPALLVVALACCRLDVRMLMAAGCLASLPLCLAVQHMGWMEMLSTLVFGYRCPDARVGALIDGGGILSMLNVTGIVLLSSSYSGIFAETGLLIGVRSLVQAMGRRIGVFGATLATSLAAAAVACNQTLGIMLTRQLCRGLTDDNSAEALNLEDSAVVVSSLVPWAIACSVPLSTVGAPTLSVCAACFLYVLPLWHWLSSTVRGERASGAVRRPVAGHNERR